jgi:hypothetical protein
MLQSERQVRASGQAEPLGRCAAVHGTVQVLGKNLEGFAHDVDEHGFLALVVPIQRRRRDTQPRRQLSHRQSIESTGHEELAC